MPSPSDHRLCIWVEAAAWALARSQTSAAQRLLVIVFDAAMRSGYADLAAVARQRLLDLNSQHQLAKYSSLSDAMTSDEFQKFVAAIQRQLSFEEAERMVLSRPVDDRIDLNTNAPLGSQFIAWLTKA